MTQLDHIMYAVPDLDRAIADLARQIGVQPALGGPHPGNGTHNALLALGENQYLEIIAPDPLQPHGNHLGQQIRQAARHEVRTWAVATRDLEPVAQSAAALGLRVRRVPMSRTTPEGMLLTWEILFLGGHAFGDLLPFFIDWKQSTHPARTSPVGCLLQSFTVTTPDPTGYETLMNSFDIQKVQVRSGEARLNAAIKCHETVLSL